MSEKMEAYETYNNYFDILDGCFEAFSIDEGKFSIATELFGGKNPFRMILDAIQAAWNWFIKTLDFCNWFIYCFLFITAFYAIFIFWYYFHSTFWTVFIRAS